MKKSVVIITICVTINNEDESANPSFRIITFFFEGWMLTWSDYNYNLLKSLLLGNITVFKTVRMILQKTPCE